MVLQHLPEYRRFTIEVGLPEVGRSSAQFISRPACVIEVTQGKTANDRYATLVVPTRSLWSAHGRTLSAPTTVVVSAKRLAGSTYFSHRWFDPFHLDISPPFPIEPADVPADTTAVVIADKVLPWALLELIDYTQELYFIS
ncbi:hypothetical protein Y032_0141g2246 [Ancylostoma ceylanicum]|uniref:Uncharacterized protein n=1 Tax=Ancylostoma ceylanicum TaxID=53326 RepID=A0A016T3U2_9BILA|nr:hypothetical protein Y032_0141g2246 [Ancylostoma ceylanicum]